MKVIVTDADDKKALAAVRFLAKKGVRVSAAGVKRWDQSFFSKYCSGRLLYPNPVRDPEAFVCSMLDYLSGHRFDCILPMSDYTTLALSKHKGQFERHTNLAVPDYETLSVVRNKPEILKIARRLGIGTPETWCPAHLDEVRELSKSISYPCVIKYKRGTGAVGLRYAHSPAELLGQYQVKEHARDIVFDDTFPMIQEYIPGETHDVCVLFNHGEPRAASTHRRARTWPPTGGRGVIDVMTWEPQLREQAVRLLREVNWHGPAQVEFKMDPHDGVPKLMEVNTRFWGGVGAEAGIDYVYLACRMAVEGDVEPVWDYEVGMMYRWAFPLEFQSIMHGENRFEDFLEYLRFTRGTRYDIWPSDPLPHLVKTAMTLYRHARMLAGRPTRRQPSRRGA